MRLPLSWLWGLAFAARCVLTGAVGAQEIEVFCPADGRPEELCIDDTLEVVFRSSGTSLYEFDTFVAGTQIDVEIVTATASEPVQAWAYGIVTDGTFLTLLENSPTTAGTIADPDQPDTVVVPPAFDLTRAVPGGWISAVVPSLLSQTQLPLGRNTVAMASYALDGNPGEAGTLIRFVDNEIGVEGTPPVPLVLTVEGIAMFPRTLTHGLVREADANTPPDGSGASLSVSECWPPNHQFVLVEVLGVTDPDGDPVEIEIDRVTQDEPVRAEGSGSGRTCPDAVRVDVDGDGVAEAAGVRCEREGGGNGRVYTVHFTATDDRGGTSSGAVRLCVRHDGGAASTCVDDGEEYDSLICPDGGAGGRFPHSLRQFDTINPEPLFMRGDIDWDEELLVTDGIVLLRRLFESRGAFDCPDAADVNDDGDVDISDAIGLFAYLFTGTFTPPPPVVGIDPDPTADGLGCE